MGVTVVLKSACVSVMLLYCLVHKSDQTSPNGIEDSIKELQKGIEDSIKELSHFYLSKWADLGSKIESMDDRLRKLNALIKKDIKPKVDVIINQLSECRPTSGIANSSLPWHTVGSDRFVRFSDPMSWDNARITCQDNSLDLLKPIDAVAVATYLDEKFSDKYYWLGGRGDGSSQVWVTTGEAVNKTGPWFAGRFNMVGTEDFCLRFLTYGSHPGNGTVLYTTTCTTKYPVLCGRPTSGIANSSLPWHTVGSDRFVRFSDPMSWDNARITCQDNSLDLLKPIDAVAVATYLDEKFSDKYYWLGGRGDGSSQVWVTTDEAVNKTGPWFAGRFNMVGTEDFCLRFLTYGSHPGNGTVLYTTTCTTKYPVLCG